jgi:hypothetical protein
MWLSTQMAHPCCRNRRRWPWRTSEGASRVQAVCGEESRLRVGEGKGARGGGRGGLGLFGGQQCCLPNKLGETLTLLILVMGAALARYATRSQSPARSACDCGSALISRPPIFVPLAASFPSWRRWFS